MTDRPRIAIPMPTSTDSAYNERCWKQYAEAVEQSGGVAVAIQLDEDPSLIARKAAQCQGVLLPGSPADVHPQKYGQEAHPQTAARDALREAADELLMQDAFNLQKPLLGICYGHQAMNVWKGGSLVQHLETGMDHAPGRTVEEAHEIVLSPAASHLYSAFSVPRAAVNSSHHQAVDRPGDGLRVAAYADGDGTLEAVEAEDGFVVGVQWHPERTFATQASSRKIFAKFVDAARCWAVPAVVSPTTACTPGPALDGTGEPVEI